MSKKLQLFYNGNYIDATEAKGHWEVHFSKGHIEKLFYHVNSEKEAIWMWESGKIDDASLLIGAMIERLTAIAKPLG